MLASDLHLYSAKNNKFSAEFCQLFGQLATLVLSHLVAVVGSFHQRGRCWCRPNAVVDAEMRMPMNGLRPGSHAGLAEERIRAKFAD